MNSVSAAIAAQGWASLTKTDPALAKLLDAEVSHQRASLSMVASASLAHPSVLCANGSVLTSVTAEGYPRARFHPGAAQFDAIEELAIARAKHVFSAVHANVQPHSCSSANLAVLGALLPRGGRLLALDLDSGGHLTHGGRASISSRHYDVATYQLDRDGYLDYNIIRKRAEEHRPHVVIAGASAYPRTIDFSEFRSISDGVGAYLIADISHIAGLVAAKLHPSPIDYAHITTTSTYKQLAGPRGGLIMLGNDSRKLAPDGRTELSKLIQQAVFPGFQGTPDPAAIAAKARALAIVSTAGFQDVMKLVITNAQALANELASRKFRVLTNGTDNHMVLIDIGAWGLNGLCAERALEECGILANRNKIQGDISRPDIGNGLRFGTNILAQRGMGPGEVCECAEIVHRILRHTKSITGRDYYLNNTVRNWARERVTDLCERFPQRLEYGTDN